MLAVGLHNRHPGVLHVGDFGTIWPPRGRFVASQQAGDRHGGIIGSISARTGHKRRQPQRDDRRTRGRRCRRSSRYGRGSGCQRGLRRRRGLGYCSGIWGSCRPWRVRRPWSCSGIRGSCRPWRVRRPWSCSGIRGSCRPWRVRRPWSCSGIRGSCRPWRVRRPWSCSGIRGSCRPWRVRRPWSCSGIRGSCRPWRVRRPWSCSGIRGSCRPWRVRRPWSCSGIRGSCRPWRVRGPGIEVVVVKAAATFASTVASIAVSASRVPLTPASTVAGTSTVGRDAVCVSAGDGASPVQAAAVRPGITRRTRMIILIFLPQCRENFQSSLSTGSMAPGADRRRTPWRRPGRDAPVSPAAFSPFPSICWGEFGRGTCQRNTRG